MADQDRPRTFAVRTYGCQMNEHDSERLTGALVADGLVPTDDVEAADVVVFNTCAIRENADQKFFGQLSRLKALREARPDMRIAVGGCLAQMLGDDVRGRAPYVDVVFGTHNLVAAPDLVRRSFEAGAGPIVDVPAATAAVVGTGIAPAPGGDGAGGGATADDEQAAALAAVRDVPYAAWVTIQTGCDNSCAFCIVPSVRGGEVSRSFDGLVEEVGVLARRGVTEVTLLGQNVNSYGRDLTRRRPLFAELLRAVGDVEGIRRVRFTSPHPKDLRPETIAAMAETPAVCNHLHLPLQSGSDAVLRRMRRGYTAQRYLERVAAARAAVDDLAVTTDLIVGFPGETESEFEDTLAVAAEAAYDSAYVFIFSPRAGTRAAARVDEFVAPDVVADRFARLQAVVERSAALRHADRVGREEEVLIEGPSKRDPATVTGRTTQNKLVHFVPSDPAAGSAGALATVVVTGAARHHLAGRLVGVTTPPRHRLRIPVSAG